MNWSRARARRFALPRRDKNKEERSGKWKERKEEGKKGGGEEERTKTKQKKREREREERWKKENRVRCIPPRDRCIRRRVSQIRNLLTMVRKAIHLDDRGESVIYWPVTPAPTWPTRNDYTFHTTRHVVSEARLLKKREGPCPFVIIIRPPPRRRDERAIIFLHRFRIKQIISRNDWAWPLLLLPRAEALLSIHLCAPCEGRGMLSSFSWFPGSRASRLAELRTTRPSSLEEKPFSMRMLISVG